VSFKSNIGKPAVEAGPEQCEMIDMHHPDCECGSCKMHVDVRCLELYVGTVPEAGNVRVCGACAIQQEREEFIVSYRDETRFVLTHPEMGVYLGSGLGLGFWSKLDPCGQSAAITFENRVQADYVMTSWNHGRPDGVVIWPVMPDQGAYASVAACVTAGLEAWDPEAKPAA